MTCPHAVKVIIDVGEHVTSQELLRIDGSLDELAVSNNPIIVVVKCLKYVVKFFLIDVIYAS